MKTVKGWRDLLAVPSYGNAVSIEHVLTLDAAMELEPLPDITDRYICLAEWFETLKYFGLITGAEAMGLRTALAPHL